MEADKQVKLKKKKKKRKKTGSFFVGGHFDLVLWDFEWLCAHTNGVLKALGFYGRVQELN